MAWRRLADWLKTRAGTANWPDMPMTLATLSLRFDAPPAKVEALEDAEYAALMGWAEAGGFILALHAPSRSELTLLCPMGPLPVTARVRTLPLTLAGLTLYDVRDVIPLSVSPAAPPGSIQ
jgi:hypothetical protein